MSTERKGFKEKMKRIDFEHGSIPGNILNAAIPMLVAHLYSKNPAYRHNRSRRGRLMFSDYCDHHGFQQPVRQRRCSAFFHPAGGK